MAEVIYSIWPPEIGDHPFRDGLTVKGLDNSESFGVEEGEGYELTRPKSAGGMLDMTATYPVTANDYPRWLAWWQDQTKEGRIAFWLREPLSRQPRLWRMQPGQSYQAAAVSANWVFVTLALRSLP